MKGVWHILQQIGASQGLTLKMAKKLVHGDRWLKRRHLSFSSSLCLYRKIDHPNPAIHKTEIYNTPSVQQADR
jgi:hypothetical protein